jgi:fluoroquinolone transport system permease protein
MITIIKTDLKNIMRDPSLLMICFVPFIILALLRWGYPPLRAIWPEAEIYSGLGLAMFCIVVAIMPGIAIAFAMLDEKDQNLQVVLQILPISYLRIIMYRTLVIATFGFLSALMLLFFSGIDSGTIFQKILLSLIASLSAPIMALIPAFFAQNKIEGATMTKLLNFLIMLPIPAFLFPGTWSWFMMIFPAWWVFFAFENTDSAALFSVAIACGTLVHLGVLAITIRLGLKRV